ncbi:MAG: hypothetical protein ACQSGP_24510 [Frankia sp.]
MATGATPSAPRPGPTPPVGGDQPVARITPTARRIVGSAVSGQAGRALADRRGPAPTTGRYCSGRPSAGDVAVRSTLRPPPHPTLPALGRTAAPWTCTAASRPRPGGPDNPNGGRSAPTDGATRSYHVFNALGEVLGSFGDWDTAHAWAHDQADQADQSDAWVPLEVEDRANRITRRVWRARCEFVAWETVAHLSFACERMAR